ncbi:MAG: hypothetical protein ACRD0D_00995 [Acidimicrobiales bacterium]
MNLSQLREAVYDLVGVPATDTLLTSAVVDRAVNQALHDAEVESEWPWLETSETVTTVAGTAAYATTALRSLYLAAPGQASLALVEQRELDDRWGSGPATAAGRPRDYALWAGLLELRPVPDGAYAYTHRYYRAEPDLALGTDTPLLPASFHTAIVELAAARVLRRNREEARAAQSIAEWQRWLARMRGHRRRSVGPSKVRLRNHSER